MDNLNELKAIWLTAKTDDLPSSNEMLQIVKKFRNQKLIKKWVMISVALLTLAMMVYTVFNYQSTMLSTRLGEAFTIIACAILATTNIKSLKRFYDLNDCSNKEFVEFLEKTRQNQIYYYKKTGVAGMALSSAGLLLYLYEMVHKNMVFFIITYAIAIIWILILWLVIRPRAFKKEERKLNATMERLKNIADQIK